MLPLPSSCSKSGLEWAKERMAAIENLYEHSALPEAPNLEKINRVLIEMIEELYG